MKKKLLIIEPVGNSRISIIEVNKICKRCNKQNDNKLDPYCKSCHKEVGL